MLHPWGAQAETQDRKTVLRRGGALAREAEKRDDFSYFLVITSKLRLDLLTCVDVYYEH